MEPHYTYGIPFEINGGIKDYNIEKLAEILRTGLIMPARGLSIISVAEATAIDDYMKNERGFPSFFDESVLGHYALVLDRSQITQKPVFPKIKNEIYFGSNGMVAPDKVYLKAPLDISESLIAVGIPVRSLQNSDTPNATIMENIQLIKRITDNKYGNIKIVNSSREDFQDISPKK